MSSRAKVAAFAIAAVVSGCATRPVADADTRLVPPDRILDPALAQRAPGAIPVVVKRDRGMTGAGCALELLVDAEPVARLRPAERVIVYLMPGNHVLSARGAGLCGWGGNVAEASADVTPGSALTFRLSIGGSGELTVNPTRF